MPRTTTTLPPTTMPPTTTTLPPTTTPPTTTIPTTTTLPPTTPAASCAGDYEAEEQELNLGSRSRNCTDLPGYSGSGYLCFRNGANQEVGMSLEGCESASYSVSARYLCWSRRRARKSAHRCLALLRVPDRRQWDLAVDGPRGAGPGGRQRLAQAEDELEDAGPRQVPRGLAVKPAHAGGSGVAWPRAALLRLESEFRWRGGSHGR